MNRDNTTDCTKILEVLPWYVNRTLGDVEHTAVASHVQTCAACRREVDFLSSVLVSMPAAIAPSDSVTPFARLQERINRQQRHEPTWKRIAAILVIAIGVAGVAVPAYLFEPRFQTATDTVRATPGVIRLELRLVEGGNTETLAHLMSRYRAELVAAPDRRGHFVLEFPLIEKMSRAELVHMLSTEPQIEVVKDPDPRTGESGQP